MECDNYDLDPSIYDEMFLPDGTPREHWRQLHEIMCGMSTEQVGGIQERVTRSVSNESISFRVYGDAEGEERVIPIDCLPRILTGSDWRFLESGLTQRLKTLNMFLEDIYNDARIVEDGVIPWTSCGGAPNTALRCGAFPFPMGAGLQFAGPTW